MSSYFREELRPATDKDVVGRWSFGKPGEFFRCGFCGHKFVEGDLFRALYTNDIKGAGGNPLVCESCNAPTETLRKRWTDKHEQWRAITVDSFWWFSKWTSHS